MVRMLTTQTRHRIEKIIERLGNGGNVSLRERILLNKYALHIPFIGIKIDKAHAKRNFQELPAQTNIK